MTYRFKVCSVCEHDRAAKDQICEFDFASDKKMTENSGDREGPWVGTRIARGKDMTILLSDSETVKEGADGVPSTRPYACASRDPRALRIIAKSIYREMRASGLAEEDLMCVAGELLSLVAVEMKDRRNANEDPPSTAVG